MQVPVAKVSGMPESRMRKALLQSLVNWTVEYCLNLTFGDLESSTGRQES